MLVKSFQGGASARLRIDWDNTDPGADVEHRLSQLSRWLQVAERTGALYTLVLPGEPVPEFDQGADHQHDCLRRLALFGL